MNEISVFLDVNFCKNWSEIWEKYFQQKNLLSNIFLNQN